jgi:hypothetical protein
VFAYRYGANPPSKRVVVRGDEVIEGWIWVWDAIDTGVERIDVQEHDASSAD